MSDNSIPENDRNKEEPAAADRVESQEEHQDMSQVEEQQSSTNISNEKESEAAGTVSSQNGSTRYKDIISKSTLIHEGRPAVYQMKPKKENIGTVTKLMFGERNLNKTNRTILLVGETGAGKSTLLNALLNYAMGVKFEDEIWFQFVEEEKNNQTESETSDVIVYEIFGYEDKTLLYSLTIIDTPGYGDTKGIERDAIVSERLLDLFQSEDGVLQINAVGLVMKGSDNRLHNRLCYVFNSVMSLFGKNLEEKIVALITHSDGRKPKNVLKGFEKAGIKCAKNEENQAVYFLFNNCQEDDRTEDEDYLKYHNKLSEKGFRAFTSFLEKSAPQGLKATTEVLKKRKRLTASIQNLQERIKGVEVKQREIKQIQKAIENCDVTVEVDEAYKVKESITGGSWGLFFNNGALCCTVCEENCHYPCTTASKPERCDIINNGRCTVCTGKCPVSDHVKENRIYKTEIRKVQKTIQVETQMSDRISLLNISENQLKDILKEKEQLVNEAYQHIIRLEEIALNINSLYTYRHLPFLIEKMKERGDTEKIRKLEEMKSRLDEEVRSALEYVG